MSKGKKKILITGASRGIGKDIALKSKENGYIVLGTSTSEEGAQGLETVSYTHLTLPTTPYV